MALYDRAIEIRERLVNQEGGGDLADGMGALYMSRVIVVSELGDNRGAVALDRKSVV